MINEKDWSGCLLIISRVSLPLEKKIFFFFEILIVPSQVFTKVRLVLALLVNLGTSVLHEISQVR